MCGIIGFLAKKQHLRESLGQMVTPMVVCMGDRGPDSAGLAVFVEEEEPPMRRYSLFSPDPEMAWQRLAEEFGERADCQIQHRSKHAVLRTASQPRVVEEWLKQHHPELNLLSVGRRIDVYKDAGHPRQIVQRYGFEDLRGTHCVGHTRMATESAVTPAHSHPFTAGEDFCLVHNGSISNPWQVRRKLERKGVPFQTDNDTEAVCRYLQWRMQVGDSIEQALEASFAELDGFYTLLIGTADKIVLVRDAFACKPAVAAETDEYVAVGSEFRTLAHLPDIGQADLFEPQPQRIYSWSL